MTEHALKPVGTSTQRQPEYVLIWLMGSSTIVCVAQWCPVMPALEPKTVLVVDDDRTSARLLELLLSADGHNVHVAHNGFAGAWLAKHEYFDVAVLDLQLGDMDGCELAALIREDPQSSHILLLAVTGCDNAEDVARARRAGFANYLVKPVDGRMLRSLLG